MGRGAEWGLVGRRFTDSSNPLDLSGGTPGACRQGCLRSLVAQWANCCKASCPQGRNYEQLTNMPGLYSVRASRSYRFVFALTDGIAEPIAVGPHDQAYGDAVRRHRRGRN